MVKEVEYALVKRQLTEAKELIAELQQDNVKLRDRIIHLEAVGPGLPSEAAERVRRDRKDDGAAAVHRPDDNARARTGRESRAGEAARRAQEDDQPDPAKRDSDGRRVSPSKRTRSCGQISR